MITSTRNRRIVDVRKLDQRKHRQRQGRFLVEGLQLLHMALDAGAKPIEVFFNEDLFAGEEAPRLLARFRDAGAELVEVSPGIMRALCERELPQGLLATFGFTDVRLDALASLPPSLLLILDRLQDPGNMGALIRTADAVGAAGVVLLTPCVDPFDPKTVRGSMGSLFNVPLVQTDDVAGLSDWLAGRGLRVVGAGVRTGELWGTGLWRSSVALVLGNEARGLSPDVEHIVEHYVRLPMVGGAESLNVAVAGGVLMYAWLRENG